MAINPSASYPTKTTAADANYPYGSARNQTTPGDGTGTPLDVNIVNDIFGFQQAILNEASIVPSGAPDNVNSSQYLDGLKHIIPQLSVKPLATVAAIQAGNLTGVTAVRTLGYYSAGGRGAAFYRADTADTSTADDGFLVIVSNDGVRFKLVFNGVLNASWAGVKGDDTTDDSAALIKWIAAGVTYKCELFGDVNGACKTTETIYLPTETVLRTNAGGRNGTGFRIKAYHTGAAVVSLKGAVGVYIDCLNLETDATTFPKTGLCLGRSSASSAGHHKISFFRFQGYASVAAIYSIASEVNYFSDAYVWLLGGGGIHTFYTSEQDDFSVDTLTKSTNIAGAFKECYFLNYSTDNDSSCYYVEMGPSTGDWNFDGYLIPTGGAYARLSTKVANFPEAPGVQPFVPGSMTFRFGGERLGPTGDPLYGVRLTTDTAVKLKNFGINHSRFDFQAGADKAQLAIDSNYILETPNVVLGPPEAFAYATVSFNPTKILGGVYSVDRLSQWTDITFSTNWNDIAAVTYGTAAYSIDGFRNIKLRGLVTATAGGISAIVINAAGTGYVAGDVLTVSGGGGDATITVDTVGGSGEVLTSAILWHGTGYTGAAGVATTGGTGTGATFDTTTPAVASTTVICVLPYGPAFDMMINCNIGSSGVFESARLLLQTNGTLSLNVGTTTKDVDLSRVSFRI